MASKKGVSMLKEEFVSKKGEDDVPVEPCKGWTVDCDFCDKRFGAWVESSDETLEKIPAKPGLFMVALRSKNIVEVRNIVLDAVDIQKKAYSCIDVERDLVADKKSKATKSVILCRWKNFKSQSDKDVVSLCAHWYNNGVRPKDMDGWPGLDLVEQSGSLVFSEKVQKWCYPKKEATWRKPKSTPTKTVEVVAECDFEEPCEVCDSNFGFSEWKPLVDVVQDNLAPRSPGIYQLGVRFGKKREVVLIGHDQKDIKFGNIGLAIKAGEKWAQSVLRNEKFKNRNGALLEVRWLEVQSVDSENSCFLWAHWLNAERFPLLNHKMPGERQLEKNKSFVLRVNDKRWCYEIDVFKQSRLSKFKAKRQIMNELEEDVKYLHCSESGLV